MSGETRLEIKQRLGLIGYNIDKEYEHIHVTPEICAKCPHYFCTYACPAQCFTLVEGRLVYRYEDCVECGTCDIACDQGSVKWTHPRGGFGVKYKFG
jgi:ferredoxin like protein